MRKTIDITGQRFNRLVVIERVEKPKEKNDTGSYWRCVCDCGKEIVVSRKNLMGKHTMSCGCLLIEFRNSGCGKKKEFGLASLNQLFNSYKMGAKRRNIEFEMSILEFKTETSKNCFYCGKKPLMSGGMKKLNGEYFYNGIDRINNNLGYKINNVVSCCKYCNRMKSDMSTQEFLDHIKLIYEWQNRKDG
jgi:hypothetical protein